MTTSAMRGLPYAANAFAGVRNASRILGLGVLAYQPTMSADYANVLPG